MHNSVLQFIKVFADLKSKTLEIGSLNVNGSVKPLFENHLGVDMCEGDCVDMVGLGKDLKLPDNEFDTILYLECMEHDLDYEDTIKNMLRMLKVGGRLFITTRSINFPYHAFPRDYYRFNKDYFIDRFKDKLIYLEDDPEQSGVFAIVTK